MALSGHDPSRYLSFSHSLSFSISAKRSGIIKVLSINSPGPLCSHSMLTRITRCIFNSKLYSLKIVPLRLGIINRMMQCNAHDASDNAVLKLCMMQPGDVVKCSAWTVPGLLGTCRWLGESKREREREEGKKLCGMFYGRKPPPPFSTSRCKVQTGQLYHDDKCSEIKSRAGYQRA